MVSDQGKSRADRRLQLERAALAAEELRRRQGAPELIEINGLAGEVIVLAELDRLEADGQGAGRRAESLRRSLDAHYRQPQIAAVRAKIAAALEAEGDGDGGVLVGGGEAR